MSNITGTQIITHISKHHGIYKRVAPWIMFGVAARQGWKSCEEFNQIAFAGPVVAIKMGVAIVSGIAGYGVTRGGFFLLKKKVYPKFVSNASNIIKNQ